MQKPFLGQSKIFRWLIIILSVAVPVVVSFLFYVPQTGSLGTTSVSILPHINAMLNSLTAICLVAGFIWIKNKKIIWHRRAMLAAFVFSSLFLISYVIYHYQGTHTLYGDADHNSILSEAEKLAASTGRYIYYSILLTHILLAAIVVPLVLFALYFALSNQIRKHKQIVKYTYPIWLYVAISGVIVYLMIKSYYLS